MARLGKLPFILSLFSKVVIPEAVYKEVVEDGIKANYSDARIVHNYIQDNKIVVKKAEIPSDLNDVLHPGEREAIALAASHIDEAILIMDEKKARLIAREKNILFHGTLGLMLAIFQENRISPEKYLENLRLYADHGWISVSLYEAYRKEAENYE